MKKIIIIGCGNRGHESYGRLLNSYKDIEIAALADPDQNKAKRAADEFGVSAENIFLKWQDTAAMNKFADAVLVATPDQYHFEPTIAFAKKGYHVLVEKPLAPTLNECIEMNETAQNNAINLTVCHVLRYAPYYQKLNEIIKSGIIGDICSISHFEGVGVHHYAHSYVRGNWRNEKESSFMLLAKSCHDIDIINWFIDRPCKNVSSFGYLKHFIDKNKPKGAADRCLDCIYLKEGCPFSIEKCYSKFMLKDKIQWPLTVFLKEFTQEAFEDAMRNGPYGRCVYSCDNDVVDHQVVNMDYEDNITASFTMAAFTPGGRKTTIMADKGFLQGDGNNISILDFETDKWQKIETCTHDQSILSGHGGGDQGLIRNYVEALDNNDFAKLTTSSGNAILSHLLVFAAEESRKKGKTININEFVNN